MLSRAQLFGSAADIQESERNRPATQEVAVVRHPIADGRNNVVGYELKFGGAVDLGDPSRDAKGTSALHCRGVRRHRARAARRPPSGLDLHRSQLPRRDRAAAGPPRPGRSADRGLPRGRRPPHPAPAALALGLHAGPRRLRRAARHPGADVALLDRQDRRDRPLRRRAAGGPRGPAGAGRAARGHGRGRPGALPGRSRTRASPTSRATTRQAAHPPPPRLATRRARVCAALGELTAGDVSFEDLERIIGSDIGLSLKLLRYVNSAFFALPRTVGSVREALSLLGVRTVRRWATVMAISAIPDVPDQLVALGLRRARMCEMLAGSALPDEKETLFTIGLFSVADALLDAPMLEVLDSLPSRTRSRTPSCAARAARASCSPPSSPTSAASSRPFRPPTPASRSRGPTGPRSVGRRGRARHRLTALNPGTIVTEHRTPGAGGASPGRRAVRQRAPPSSSREARTVGRRRTPTRLSRQLPHTRSSSVWTAVGGSSRGAAPAVRAQPDPAPAASSSCVATSRRTPLATSASTRCGTCSCSPSSACRAGPAVQQRSERYRRPSTGRSSRGPTAIDHRAARPACTASDEDGAPGGLGRGRAGRRAGAGWPHERADLPQARGRPPRSPTGRPCARRSARGARRRAARRTPSGWPCTSRESGAVRPWSTRLASAGSARARGIAFTAFVRRSIATTSRQPPAHQRAWRTASRVAPVRVDVVDEQGSRAAAVPRSVDRRGGRERRRWRARRADLARRRGRGGAGTRCSGHARAARCERTRPSAAARGRSRASCRASPARGRAGAGRRSAPRGRQLAPRQVRPRCAPPPAPRAAGAPRNFSAAARARRATPS